MPLPPLRVLDSSDTPGEFNARLLCSCRVSRATAIAADEDTGDSKTVGADATVAGATCDVSTVKLLPPTCVRESKSALDACGEPVCAVPTATRASLQNPTGRATFSHTPAVKASGLNRLRSWWAAHQHRHKHASECQSVTTSGSTRTGTQRRPAHVPTSCCRCWRLRDPRTPTHPPPEAPCPRSCRRPGRHHTQPPASRQAWS